MTGSMQIVKAFTPKASAPHCIKLCTRGAIWELNKFYLYMSFENECIDTFHLLAHRSKSYRSGYICGSVLILGTRIDKNHPFRTKLSIRLRCGFIMNDGTMFLITGNGIEGNITKKRLFRTKGCQLAINRHFCLSTHLYRRLQPTQELHHCYSIPQHSPPESLHLGFVLYGLHNRNRRSRRHNLLTFHSLPQPIACFVTIKQDIIFRVSPQFIFHLIIFI